MLRLTIFAVFLVACEGPGGPAGPNGEDGASGEPGGVGVPGTPGASPWIVGDGVDIAVQSFTVSATAASVRFSLKDGAGRPLDRSGMLTEGTVSLSFVLAQLTPLADGSPGQYTAYTTNAAATKAATETAGTFATVDLVQGIYDYTFAAPLTGFDPTRTQTVASLVVRTFRGAQSIDRETKSVVPGGGTPAHREEVIDARCDSCHGDLAAHGGRWNQVDQCVMCHQPQSVDPGGKPVDFKVMIHKIHRGKALPSVIAGQPYQLVGFGNSVHDYSTVAFPQNIARCESCHGGDQGERWKTKMSIAACTSCHDTTIFDGTPVPPQVAHSGGTGPNVNEASCVTCHSSVSVIAPVDARHYRGLLDPTLPKFTFEILSMTNTAPGQIPVMTFTALENTAPRDLIAAPMSIVATIAGPNTDFASFAQSRIQGAGAVGTLAIVDASTGTYSYTFPATATIAPAATGSYTVGIEASFTPPIVPPATTSPRIAPVSPTFAFAVTDVTVMPRRQIVEASTCNGCHQDLSFGSSEMLELSRAARVHSRGSEALRELSSEQAGARGGEARDMHHVSRAARRRRRSSMQLVSCREGLAPAAVDHRRSRGRMCRVSSSALAGPRTEGRRVRELPRQAASRDRTLSRLPHPPRRQANPVGRAVRGLP